MDIEEIATLAYREALRDAGGRIKPYVSLDRVRATVHRLVKEHPEASGDAIIYNAAIAEWLAAMFTERQEWRRAARATKTVWGLL